MIFLVQMQVSQISGLIKQTVLLSYF